ncbi:dTDP-4-dehydrorhamnose 3,5-epimerase [bacterium]|jgi:dTDP-4-dehydrorhamnose 3,5-epimerase|nr:dTDP-4-dehydrorhamnose 3,5-epimerase [bacterium]
MNISTPLLIKPRLFKDNRGHFFEKYKQSSFKALGINEPIVQLNESKSTKGTLRGLHFQIPPYSQAKIVSVCHGEILDVVVDINPFSPTFKTWKQFNLSSENRHSLYVPGDYAHGFLVLSDEAVVQYMCSSEYSPESERGIIWNEKEFGIEWPVQEGAPLQFSEKDEKASSLSSLKDELKSVFRK